MFGVGVGVSEPLRITIARNDLASLIEALDELIASYGPDDTSYVENEIRLRDRLGDRLRKHDSERRAKKNAEYLARRGNENGF